MSPNRPHKPYLRHAHDSPKDTEAKSDGGCDARGEAMRGGVVGDVVAMDAAFEEEVFGECDAFVDGEPVALEHVRRLEEKGKGVGGNTYDNQHEILQDRLKMTIARN